MTNRRVLLVFALLVSASKSVSAEPVLTHADVFTAGERGYHGFRIPAVQSVPDGSLIAFAEARKHNLADPGMHENDIDLVYKRSTDRGETWSELIVLDDPGDRWSACNPATLLDRSLGRIWVFHCRTKPGRSSYTARPGTDDCQNWARHSDDSGRTWSQPVDLTAVARDVGRWGGSFFGPGGGIEDGNGRLIVPLSRTTGRKNENGEMVGGPWNAFVIYSEDHGRSWQRGQLLPDGEWGNESQVVELPDGRILMDIRQNEGPHRWHATSGDGGQMWSVPTPGQAVTPVACAIERITLRSAGHDRDRILWTGPKGPGRAVLVVRVSYDGGASFDIEKTISEEKAAYSDLTVIDSSTAGVLWERDDYRFITFSRFNLEFLEGPSVLP